VYIYHSVLKLGLPIKGAGLPEGLEILSRQDELGEGEFANAIRAPLGVNRGARERAGGSGSMAPTTPSAINWHYLCRIRKISAAQLASFIAGKTPPDEFVQHSKRPEAPKRYFSSPAKEFRILDYIPVLRQELHALMLRIRLKKGDGPTTSITSPYSSLARRKQLPRR